MISIVIKGGLGNQLFQYSFGLAVSKYYKQDLVLDISWYEDSKLDFSRSFELGRYFLEIPLKITHNHSNKFRKYTETSYRFDKNVFALSDSKDMVFDGYWQSHLYFNSVVDDLRQIFNKKSYIKENYPDLIAKLSEENTVAIHIRRGDYKNPSTYEYHGVCGIEYYAKAISYIKSNVENPKYFVFTDDRDWVNGISLGVTYEIIDVSLKEGDWIDLHLMSLCKHNLIANSSFSWWAAYLNDNPQKIVICPDRWFFPKDNRTKDLIPNDWIKMPNYSCAVSIIIPTYNRKELLKKALESCFNQTFVDFEILVCDDGSTDDSRELFKEFNDNRLRWIDCIHSGKPATPRNIGIEKAQGEWVAFLDSDDEWLPNKLEEQFKCAKENNAKFICSNAYKRYINEYSDLYFESSTSRFYNTADLLSENKVICSSVLLHASMLSDLRFDESDITKAFEDYGLWLKISVKENVYYLSDPLLIYLMDSVSSVRKKVRHSDEKKKKYVVKELLKFKKKAMKLTKEKV